MEHSETDAGAMLAFLRRVDDASAQIASLMQAIEALLLDATAAIQSTGQPSWNAPEAGERVDALMRAMWAACRLGEDVVLLARRLRSELSEPMGEVQHRIDGLTPAWKDARAAAMTYAQEAEQMVRRLGIRAKDVTELADGLASRLEKSSEAIAEELISRLRVRGPR